MLYPLVPTLRVGTHVWTLCVPSSHGARRRASHPCVATRSVGTREFYRTCEWVRPDMLPLVPTQSVGTPAGTLCVPSSHGARRRASHPCVPTRSVGTREFYRTCEVRVCVCWDMLS